MSTGRSWPSGGPTPTLIDCCFLVMGGHNELLPCKRSRLMRDDHGNRSCLVSLSACVSTGDWQHSAGDIACLVRSEEQNWADLFFDAAVALEKGRFQ